MTASPLPASNAPESWPSYVCPDHGHVLAAGDGRLACPEGHDYRIEGGVARFVTGSNYADHFGAQWNRYRVTQLDSHSGVPISTNRARRCIGERIWCSLGGKQVLEVGCGAGRFTEVLLGQGAHVTSVDLSLAVDANIKNFPAGPRHRVAQANATRLPFQPGSFDVVFCLGVVQHTPVPEDTMRSLYEMLKPGGTLVFDHYTHNLSASTKLTEPAVRSILRRLSPPVGLKATETLVSLFLPAHRLASKIPLGQQVLSRFSPIRAYYHAYPELTPELQREWARLDTHDALTTVYRHLRRPAQVAAYLRGLGAQDIHTHRSGAFVEVRVGRPK